MTTSKEFRLVGNSPAVWAITRALIVLVLSVMVLSFSLVLAGNLDWDGALVLTLVLALAPPVSYWYLRGVSNGVVRVTPTHLIVHTGIAEQVVPWEDITEITIAKVREMSEVRRVYTSILRLDPDLTLVLVRLARLLKNPLIPWMAGGTRARFAFPTITKMLELDIEDKEGFVQEAQRYLRT